MYHTIFNIESLPGEQWIDINDYGGRYQCSNLGRIKNTVKCKILKQSLTTKGYLCIGLSKEGVFKTWLSHVLIAAHFIENPYNKQTVNHKLGVKTDNRVSQLEWATVFENCRHSFDVLGRKNAHISHYNKNHKSKKVICHNNGVVYYSQREAARQLDLRQSNVKDVCKGRYTDTKGYKFSYYNDEIKL